MLSADFVCFPACSPARSGYLAIVVVQHSPKPWATADRSCVVGVWRFRNDQAITQTLVVSLVMIMLAKIPPAQLADLKGPTRTRPEFPVWALARPVTYHLTGPNATASSVERICLYDGIAVRMAEVPVNTCPIFPIALSLHGALLRRAGIDP